MRLLSEMIARSANGKSRIVTTEDVGSSEHDAPNGRAHEEPQALVGSLAQDRSNDTAAPQSSTEAILQAAEPDGAAAEQVQSNVAPPAAPTRQALAQQAMEVLKARATSDPAPNSDGGRVKTRLLGFNAAGALDSDLFDTPADEAAADGQPGFPVGWMVVISGPGLGQAFTLHEGVAQIGRGEDQAIRLDFGDTAISRANHAAVAYDIEQNGFFLGHGGKANIVRLNNQPVLSTERLQTGDEVRIGETTLRFVALCDDDFVWDMDALDGDSLV